MHMLSSCFTPFFVIEAAARSFIYEVYEHNFSPFYPLCHGPIPDWETVQTSS
jgi:hypothetical protein